MDSNFVQAHSNLGAAYVQKSMFKEALAEFEKALVTSPGSTVGLSGLGYAYAVTGRRDEAKKVLDQLNQFSKQKYVPATELVRIYAGLGEKDKAFEWLKKGYEERSIAVNADIPLDPAYDPLRSDPRFAHLLRRMNLQPCRHENICAIVADFQR